MNAISADELIELGERAMMTPDVPERLRDFCTNTEGGFEGDKVWSPDNSSFSPYYFFLYLVAQRVQPKLWVECGLELGRATAFVAHAAPECRCIGIDIGGKICATWLEFLNELSGVAIRRCDSIDWALTNRHERIDLLHLDSEHSYDQCLREFCYFRPLMAPGGLIFMDDISSAGPLKVWSQIGLPKIVFRKLHGPNGWGTCCIPKE